MISESLYNSLYSYIESGRVKAPPESSLRDLISTFQPGAQTHRRALQSKFKSWARRMAIRNGNLVLAATGKLILPEEKCKDLIMFLHSENHAPVRDIIIKIHSTYTFGRKDFGMDIDKVYSVIKNNCKNIQCLLKVREFYRWRNKYILSPAPCGAIVSQWRGNPEAKNANLSLSTHSREDVPCAAEEDSSVAKPVTSNGPQQNPQNQVVINNEESCDDSLVKFCKKPKNVYDFKRLLKLAEENPARNPAILKHPKTIFLSCLGLVPKKICSKKLLDNFKKEQRKKKLQQKRFGGYFVFRKGLRDRNKLQKRQIPNYDVKLSKYLAHFDRKPANQQVGNRMPINEQHPRPESPEVVEVPPPAIQKSVEVIDLSSDDDENPTFDGTDEKPDEISNNVDDVKKTAVNTAQTQKRPNVSHMFPNPGLYRFAPAFPTSNMLRTPGIALRSPVFIPIAPNQSVAYLNPQAFRKIRPLKPTAVYRPANRFNHQYRNPVQPQKVPHAYLVYLPEQPTKVSKNCTAENTVDKACATTTVVCSEADTMTSETYLQKQREDSLTKKVATFSVKDASSADVDQEVDENIESINSLDSQFRSQMRKISEHTDKLKKSVVTTNIMYQKPRRNLVTQFNAGISLVRDARNTLLGIENCEPEMIIP